ncbi:MAG: FtsX-like permease family protein [Methylomonas sp.]|jgi:putative ABC transport system permease protein
MTLFFKIAFRNILRNRRRSAMTGSAVAVGALALLVYGSFTTYLFSGFETHLVQRIGHLSVFHNGYYQFGAGNPSAYSIDNYRQVMDLIVNDAELKPLIRVITPRQSLVGIAGNFEGANNAAKTFIGLGLVPADRNRMLLWDEFGASRKFVPDTRFDGDDESIGLIGGGLARILGVCAALQLENCPAPPANRTAAAGAPLNADIYELAQRDAPDGGGAPNGMPRLELLSATAGGAPNVVSLRVAGVEPQGIKEMDDNYIAMRLGLAQQLVYGRGEHKATGIVLQLNRSEDIGLARNRLTDLLKEHNLDLEVLDFAQLTPFYVQVVNMFNFIFLFIMIIMTVIVLFAVVNTMTMNVMERTSEIGAVRAMGVRRSGIRRQFLVEGSLIGAIGASAGLILASLVVIGVNSAELTWIPPGNSNPIPFRLDLFGSLLMVCGVWAGLALAATLAALLPANRAARLPIVDALRHV